MDVVVSWLEMVQQGRIKLVLMWIEDIPMKDSLGQRVNLTGGNRRVVGECSGSGLNSLASQPITTMII